ncbi:MAG: YraN family protein [Brachymonas sp.]|nr:YraN family protein [Brachymonas sp.]
MGLFHRINQLLAPGRPAASPVEPASRQTAAAPAKRPAGTRKAVGDAAETAAIAWLEQQGLTLLARNYKTPGRGGGEIDAIMRAADGTIVFVEVRLRTGQAHGGAAASVHATKQRRIIHAAQHYVQQLPHVPACRFDVMACDQPGPPWRWTWLIAAFDAHG